MNLAAVSAADATESMSLVAFTAVATITLLLCVMTGPDRDDLDEFYTGGPGLTPLRNGLAIAGDYISAASVLGGIGVIALTGYDGVVLLLATALSLVLLMFLLAEPLRNAGRFTMGDTLTRRLSGPSARPARIATAVATLAALLPLMLVQLAGAGDLLAFVLGFGSLGGEGVKTGSMVLVGVLMIAYAAIGGMRGTALIQIIKIVILLASAAVVSVLVLLRFDGDFGALAAQAARGSGLGEGFLRTGPLLAGSVAPQLDMVVSQLTVVLGAACLPHVTMRMYTARSAPEVRRSMSWAVSAATVFALFALVIGFGAAALVGRQAIVAADPQGNTSILLATRSLFGAETSGAETLIFTCVATAVFLTLLASVGGMILACANSLAHDVFAHRRRISPRAEMTTARVAALAVGVVTIALASMVQHRNLQPLVTLSFCLGASALAPALVYSLFWRRFTRTGLLCTLLGGSAGAIILMTGTNLVSGGPGSAFPDHDFNWFPFTTPGIASIPLGFGLGWLGTVLSSRTRRREQRRAYEAVEAEILAGGATRVIRE
ncbi:cation acetate symporter [Streptomyces sp. N35]|uniref:sodium/solute symporter n=1 Tax=Streptomyces sp. N35 TaxID=2795730 RepID=UPI0018F49127|nr:cation acetate symporter [Streptomyces sp. N35]